MTARIPDEKRAGIVADYAAAPAAPATPAATRRAGGAGRAMTDLEHAPAHVLRRERRPWGLLDEREVTLWCPLCRRTRRMTGGELMRLPRWPECCDDLMRPRRYDGRPVGGRGAAALPLPGMGDDQ